MTTIDVEPFKTRLTEERERTARAIAYLHEEYRGETEAENRELAGGADDHLGDVASNTYDRELDSTLEESEEAHLGHIDAALKRIEDGKFGICENCGKPIGIERLEAMPWVTLCIDCKREAERR
jgi:RNA polymerase-binding transcription factor